MICGNCKDRDQTVEHVKACYAGRTIQAAVIEVQTAAYGPVLLRQGDGTKPVLPNLTLEPVEGIYVLDGCYFNVIQSDDTGRWYAKVWNGVQWEYVGRKPLRSLTAAHRCTAEQAKVFGDLTSKCVFCFRKLTNTDPGCSVDRGYGPVCADHNGLPWGA